MPFPASDRVIYDKNPLDQVVCQLRFPPILRIDAELPADFQDRIRAEFPNLAEAVEWKAEVSQGSGQVPLELLQQAMQSTGNRNYEFSSEDGQWKVNLTRTYLALTTTHYERWEVFRQKLELPLKALSDIYAPSHFSRVGLRYIDVIRRSKLGLTDVVWADLIAAPVAGSLSSATIAASVRQYEAAQEIELARREGTVRLITRLVDESAEQSFLIDSDFFCDWKTELGDAGSELDFFHERSSRLMRWCITDKLHNAMGPRPL
jgi:uncharacterized protein (TIGR04255 family)